MKIIEGRHCKLRPIPSDWVRIRFEIDSGSIDQVDRWISDNIPGRWSSYFVPIEGRRFIVIAFESTSDAVLFKIKNGETAWKESK